MLPEWFNVNYCVSGDGARTEKSVEARGYFDAEYADDAVSIAFDAEGDVYSLTVHAARDVVLLKCRLGFLREFGEGTRILMNGYQSWTDTVELGRDDRMVGLLHVPTPAVERWVLHGGGDYQLVEYTGLPGKLHGFTYAVFRDGNDCELLGSLGEDDGFTAIFVDTNVDSVIVEKECPVQTLAAGQDLVLCRLASVHGRREQAYDRWFELSGVRALPAPAMVGYTSWYRHYGDVCASKLLVDLQGARSVLDDVDCSGLVQLFQIDDGYCAVGDWLDVRADRFPQGMASMAHRIRSAGFMPGIWVAPFVCERGSALYAQHPDWLLRDDAGEPVRTGSHWSGGFALDTLNPQVREYVTRCLRTITGEWGFELVKADFLYAACMQAHGGMNRGQLMADAMGLLRQAVGPDVAILACGVPLGSVFGRVEYCRIGCDVGPDWDDAPNMRMLHRERVSTRNSLANTVFRGPLDGRAFACDPDVFYLRDDVKLKASQREGLLAADAAYGSVLLTSDDMRGWDERSQALYRAAVDVLRQRKCCG